MSLLMRTTLIASGIFIAGQGVLAQGAGDDAQWRIYLWNGHLGYAILAGLVMLLLFAVVMGGIAWIVCRMINGQVQNPGTAGPVRFNPHQIQEERFARGEIDKTEFEDCKRLPGQ